LPLLLLLLLLLPFLSNSHLQLWQAAKHDRLHALPERVILNSKHGCSTGGRSKNRGVAQQGAVAAGVRNNSSCIPTISQGIAPWILCWSGLQ
jgi:hypothetical protein